MEQLTHHKAKEDMHLKFIVRSILRSMMCRDFGFGSECKQLVFTMVTLKNKPACKETMSGCISDATVAILIGRCIDNRNFSWT